MPKTKLRKMTINNNIIIIVVLVVIIIFIVGVIIIVIVNSASSASASSSSYSSSDEQLVHSNTQVPQLLVLGIVGYYCFVGAKVFRYLAEICEARIFSRLDRLIWL